MADKGLKVINIRIPVEVYTPIKSYADSRKRSMAWVVNQILEHASKNIPEEIKTLG